MPIFFGLITQISEETDTQWRTVYVCKESHCLRRNMGCEEFEMIAVEAKGRGPKLRGKLQAFTELQTRTCGC